MCHHAHLARGMLHSPSRTTTLHPPSLPAVAGGPDPYVPSGARLLCGAPPHRRRRHRASPESTRPCTDHLTTGSRVEDRRGRRSSCRSCRSLLLAPPKPGRERPANPILALVGIWLRDATLRWRQGEGEGEVAGGRVCVMSCCQQ